MVPPRNLLWSSRVACLPPRAHSIAVHWLERVQHGRRGDELLRMSLRVEQGKVDRARELAADFSGSPTWTDELQGIVFRRPAQSAAWEPLCSTSLHDRRRASQGHGPCPVWGHSPSRWPACRRASRWSAWIRPRLSACAAERLAADVGGDEGPHGVALWDPGGPALVG